MKKNMEKMERKARRKEPAQPVKRCLMSLNSYLNSYLTALDSAGIRR